MPKQIDDQVVYEATLEMLLSYGYAGATTKLIAQAADINEVTLFRKYGNKAELVAAAVRHGAVRLREDDIVYTGDVLKDLQRVLVAYTSVTERHGRFFSLIMSEMSRYPELQSTLNGPQEVVSKIGDLLRRYQVAGVLREEHPFHAVTALLGPIIVNTMIRTASPNFPMPPIDLDLHIEGFINGRLRPV